MPPAITCGVHYPCNANPAKRRALDNNCNSTPAAMFVCRGNMI
jgi:hypothetical protein